MVVKPLVQLALDGATQPRVRMAEQVHPPRTHAVDEAMPLEVLQPCTIAARHRPKLEAINRESIRQMLKKTSVNLGAK